MPDEELQAFVKDLKNGTPTPPVEPDDIRRMWEFTCRVRDEYDSSGTHIGLRSVGLPVGIPEASLGPVWVRTGLLDELVQSGVLKPWTPGSEYEQRVFEVVAKFPVQVGEFDGDEFLRQVGKAR